MQLELLHLTLVTFESPSPGVEYPSRTPVHNLVDIATFAQTVALRGAPTTGTHHDGHFNHFVVILAKEM
jgi:hypothetical protein